MRIFKICKKYICKYKYRFITYILINIAISCLAILSPYISGNFIDNLIINKDINEVYYFCAIFAIITFGRQLFGYITSLLYVNTQIRMGYEFNSDVIQHVQKLSLNYTNSKDSIYLNQIINNDANNLVIFCLTVIQNVTVNVFYLFIPWIILARMNFLIAIIFVLFNIAYVIIYNLFRKTLYEVSLKEKNQQSIFFSKLCEQLRYIKFVRLNSAEKLFKKRVDDSFKLTLLTCLKSTKINYLYSSCETIVSTIAQITLFLIGGIQILNGNFTIGMFTIFSNYFNLMMSSAKYFYGFGKIYQDYLVSYDRITEIINQKEETNGKSKIKNVEKIKVDNLKFFYDGKPVLDKQNFIFKKGNIYAIGGVNGSGKSTFINLLVGFYINEKIGDIYYNNEELKGIDINYLRSKHIGVSEQEPFLINDTIRYNLYLDSEDDTIDNNHILARYVDTLNLSEFISQLPQGINTMINEKNNNISGGEKQKLSILRVLLKNPDVMIFDEPTSALDADTSKRFIDLLCSIKYSKIIIIVTHDTYIKEKCDIIYSLSV